MTPATGLGPCVPLRARENFGFRGPEAPKSLKKSRAARAKVCPTNHRIQDFAVGTGKSEDHAKTTYSFIDFSSRHGAKR